MMLHRDQESMLKKEKGKVCGMLSAGCKMNSGYIQITCD